MKQLKDIVLTGFLALLAFTACTEEKLIDERPMETGTVSISFSTEGVETKAINADGTYQYATADELNIKNIFVSIFKKVDNEWKYLISKTGTLGDGSFVGTQSSGSFKLTGLTLPLNTELKVVAIVNPLEDKVASYAEMDYNGLSAETVTYTGTLGGEGYYTFDPKTLIKAGEQDMKFTATSGVISGGKDVHLKQLVAKVELDLDVELPKMEGSTTTSKWTLDGYSMDDIINKLSKRMSSASNKNKPVIVYVDQSGALKATGSGEKVPAGAKALARAWNNSADKDCANQPNTSNKYAHIESFSSGNPITMAITTTTPTWLFNLISVQVLNVNTQSKLIIPTNQLNDAIYVLFCRDIEFACDEKVIKKLDNEQRADYMQALLSCSVSRSRFNACPLAFGEVGIKERVKTVMNYRKPSVWVILIAVLACAALAVCFLTCKKTGAEFEMRGDNIADIDPDYIVSEIRKAEKLNPDAEIYTRPGGFSLDMDSDFELWDNQTIVFYFKRQDVCQAL